MITHNFIFEFSFPDETEQTEKIPFKAGFTPDNFDDFMEQEWDSFIDPLEHKYGVHDFTGHGQPDGSWDIGFTTYEVDKGKVNELMDIWKTKLKAIGAI
jgi:hypothetical protein